MACPHKKNIDETYKGKLRKRRPDIRLKIVPIVIGCMIGGMKKVKGQIKKVLTDDKIVTAVAQEMLRTILCRESHSIRITFIAF